MNTLSKSIILAAAGMVVLAGCATPRSNELEQARQSYSEVQADQNLSGDASVALYEAKQALEMAESADDLKAQRHYAYLAQKKIELAQAQSNQAQASQELDDLKAQQEEFLTTVRQRQAEEARQEAQQAKQELQAYQSQANAAQLESARQEATEAQSELEQLRKEMSNMQSRDTDAGVVLTLTDVIFEFDKAQLKPGA
ncbi:MAG: DUF4398 domain-containing protein, partial [Desulfosarcina sp.]